MYFHIVWWANGNVFVSKEAVKLVITLFYKKYFLFATYNFTTSALYRSDISLLIRFLRYTSLTF